MSTADDDSDDSGDEVANVRTLVVFQFLTKGVFGKILDVMVVVVAQAATPTTGRRNLCGAVEVATRVAARRLEIMVM